MAPIQSAMPVTDRIVSARHVERLAGLMASGQVVHGGEMDRADRYIAPTLLTDVALESPIMQEENVRPAVAGDRLRHVR